MRPRGLEQEDSRTRRRVRGERGGASAYGPASKAPSGCDWCASDKEDARAALLLVRAQAGAEPCSCRHWFPLELGGTSAPATGCCGRELQERRLENPGAGMLRRCLSLFPRVVGWWLLPLRRWRVVSGYLLQA